MLMVIMRKVAHTTTFEDARAVSVCKELTDKHKHHRNERKSVRHGVILETLRQTLLPKLIRSRFQQVDKSRGNNDTATKVLGKVVNHARDAEIGNPAREDREDGENRRGDKNDE